MTLQATNPNVRLKNLRDIEHARVLNKSNKWVGSRRNIWLGAALRIERIFF